uniref:Uncharacterized protein n=1 Tax=Amphiprion percula TaxID=161767 RepID=A0A3P8T1T7_AMPPE
TPCGLIFTQSAHFYSFYLDRTIRSAVEQHLFDVNPLEEQHSGTSEFTTRPSSPKVTLTARQRRWHQRDQQEEGLKLRERNRYRKSGIVLMLVVDGTSIKLGGQSGHTERTPKPRKSKHTPTLVQLTDNQAAHAVSHFHLSSRFVTIWGVSVLCFIVAFFFLNCFFPPFPHCDHRSTASLMKARLC